MSDRNTGVGRRRHRRGYAGDDFKGNASLDQRQSFFSAPAKDERITALEADDRTTGTRMLHEHAFDLHACGGSGRGIRKL